MLRMDGFDYLHASTPEEAVALWQANPDSMYLAGGTDLLPNIKHRIFQPRHLIGIGQAMPSGWQVEDGELVIGAGTRIRDLAGLSELPPLAEAAGLIAGPQIRNMGTLGGNVFLDTRCIYYNQTEHWRKSLGWCLKAQGDWCHVIEGPKTCVATQSSDTVPVLMALDARLRILGSEGPRELSVRKLYSFDGKDHLKIEPGELLTHIIVPLPAEGFRGTYDKIRMRGAIDFPMLSVAVCGTFEGTTPTSLDIVIGAINPAPKPIAKLEQFCGQPLGDEQIEAIAELCWKRTRPQGSIVGPGDDIKDWRRHMARVTVARALRRLRDAG